MKKYILYLLALLFGSLSACMQEPEIAQFRGPDRNGVFPDTTLLETWPAEGPELLWVYEGLGRGYASPAVSGGKVYINGEEDGRAFLFCLDTRGKLLWKKPHGNVFLGEGFSSTYPGARATPTVYNDRVFTTSGMGRITCLSSENGEEFWAMDIVGELGAELGYFGYSESVAVDEERVYAFPGGARHNFIALDKKSGEVCWTSEALLDTFAYGSPVLLDLPEGKAVMATSRHHVFLLERESGSLLSFYQLEGYEYDGEHCNTPIYEDGFVYFVANDIPGQGSMKLRLTGDGSEISEMWRNPGVLNNFGGFVVVGGKIFTTVKGNKLLGLDGETGAISDSLKVASGSIIYAGRHFITYGHNGRVNLVAYRNGELLKSGEMKVEQGSGQHFSHPVVADGILYIRRGDALMAYLIR